MLFFVFFWRNWLLRLSDKAMQYSVKYVISSDFQSEASRNYQEIWMKNSTQFLVKKNNSALDGHSMTTISPNKLCDCPISGAMFVCGAVINIHVLVMFWKLLRGKLVVSQAVQ